MNSSNMFKVVSWGILGALVMMTLVVPAVTPVAVVQAATCNPQVKFDYLTIGNIGGGNMQPQTFVGTNQVVGDNQWFDLKPADSSLASKNSPGLLVQRLSQGVRVVFPGNHPQPIPHNAELVAVKISLKDAVFTGFQQDPNHPIEGQGDNHADDPNTHLGKIGVYNAELFLTPGSSEALFNARVTTNEDNFTMFYSLPDHCTTPTPVPACSDGKDNDNDGLIDMQDPGCSSPTDNNEGDGTSQCQDGKDNDNDGLVDMQDPGCSSPQDNNEGDGTSQCQDGKDNDGDGATDHPNDFSCSSPQDNDETNPKSQCQDGKDNDGDGKVDMQDPGCANKQDNDESNAVVTPVPKAQCKDGKDNDNDGYVDGKDSGCHTDGNPNNPNSYNPNDNSEDAPVGQCSDNVDNDSDTHVDGADPQCHTDGNAGNPASYDPTRAESVAATPTPGITIINNNQNNNENKVVTGDVKVTTGDTKVTTGKTNVVVKAKDQTVTKPAVAGTDTGKGAVPVTAKTGAAGVLSIALTLLGGGGVTTIIRRFA